MKIKKFLATDFPISGRKSKITRYGYEFYTGEKLPKNVKSLKKKRGATRFVEVR